MTVNRKIYMEGEGITTLDLFVGTLTKFEPPDRDLLCCTVAVLADDHHTASAFIAMIHPDWEIQTLTNLTAFVWFKRITLDSNCPQAAVLQDFIIKDIKAVPVNDEESTFHKR